MSQTLYKKEKLCSATAIDMLFGCGADATSMLAFPLRAVWRQNPGRRSDAPVQFLISVPKKRLHHAVDRVKMRRRIREAYRLHKADIQLPADARVDIAFVYVDSKLLDYARVEKAMVKILSQMAESVATKRDEGNVAD